MQLAGSEHDLAASDSLTAKLAARGRPALTNLLANEAMRGDSAAAESVLERLRQTPARSFSFYPVLVAEWGGDLRIAERAARDQLRHGGREKGWRGSGRRRTGASSFLLGRGEQRARRSSDEPTEAPVLDAALPPGPRGRRGVHEDGRLRCRGRTSQQRRPEPLFEEDAVPRRQHQRERLRLDLHRGEHGPACLVDHPSQLR